ncbi:MAG TPA: thermonuclease family protein [Planctomycetota bacterium]|nr:thermonuclease family protein [Planctomycetota bacterium]
MVLQERNATQRNATQRNAPLWLLSFLIGLFLLILPACSKAGAEAQPTSSPAESSPTGPIYPVKEFSKHSVYKIVRVVDGDTVVISIDNKDVKIRLIGIDTPETVDPRKPVQAYGKEASNFLANLLKGEAVYIEYDGEKSELDKYGRLLAYLYRVPDGLFVNLEIVRQGYGHAYTKYPFKYMELFRVYEKRARENEKGLWAPDVAQKPDATPSPIQPPDVKDNTGTNKEEQKEITVYVTRTGSKYHRADCKYLAKSKIPMPLKEAKTKYGPCSVCNPPE